MSAQAISLKSKPVVAVVLVLLAVVVVANVAYFKPGKKSPARAEVRVQSAQPLPIDLGAIQRDGTVPQQNIAAWDNSAAPTLERDPFGRIRTVEAIEQSLEQPDAEEPTGPAPLMCNAVLLGGSNPKVLINGKGYRVGDKVREYQVAAIDATGVKLIQNSGEAFFLSVHADRQKPNPGRIVNEYSQHQGRGRTSLVEHARGERK